MTPEKLDQLNTLLNDYGIAVAERLQARNAPAVMKADAKASAARKSLVAFFNLPVDVMLYCPHCRAQHVDQPQPEREWTNPSHRSHECQHCGYTWRPADVATNGVTTEAIKTKGERDNTFAAIA